MQSPLGFYKLSLQQEKLGRFFFSLFRNTLFSGLSVKFKALQSILKKLNVDFCCIEAEAK